MGKRVDFSARTVITADPNLGIDQVILLFLLLLNVHTTVYTTYSRMLFTVRYIVWQLLCW
jgi:RNA polymerase Rpb1, domain 2